VPAGRKKTPVWVPVQSVRAIYSELMAEHGGLSGPAREGSLEAALARPQQLFAYADPRPSLARLAASYAYGLARGHCFPDGNKRISLSILDVFLQLNGRELTAGEVEVVFVIRELASGVLSEDELAEWIDVNSRKPR
jgi:death on curing protein